MEEKAFKKKKPRSGSFASSGEGFFKKNEEMIKAISHK